MSNKTCCVPGCSSSRTDSDVILHRFPNPTKSKDLFNSWVYSVGGEILGLENDHIFKYRRVCHTHFEEKYWCRNKRLSNIAVPTRNMPGLLASPKLHYEERRPLRLLQNKTNEPSTSKEKVAVDPSQDLFALPPQSDKDIAAKENIETVSESTGVKTVAVISQLQTATLVDSKQQQYHEHVPETTQEKSAITQLESASLVGPEQPKYHESEQLGNSGIHHKRKGRPRQFVTQAEETLKRKLMTIGIKLSKCRKTIKRQAIKLKSMQNIMTNPHFTKIINNLPSTTRILTLMQFRENKKNIKGRRFTMKEKILALSIFKQSPKGYRFFRKIFILPSPQTLIKLLNMANIRPGINKNITQQIKKATQKMKVEDRLCLVLFDEMSLKPHVTYNERKDLVTGFVTNGEETRPEFADHAQVFMIRGLVKNYKQPVSYTFSQSATKGPELAKQLKSVIAELQDAGLIIVGTICDQGTNNVQCIKYLVQETRGSLLRQGRDFKGNHFIINDQEIIPLYDPPHMLKCVRNNLITKNLKYEKDNTVKTAKWEHIINLHKENPGYRGIRLVPKLTDNHCIPNKIPKMKVKYATQLFSQTVATNMGYMAEKGILSSESKETADALLFFDRLFDSVNGSYGKKNKHGKPLLGPVTPTSIHHEVWKESQSILKSMKFLNCKTSKNEYVPCINNWVWTLEGIELLLNNIKKYGVTSVWMRHLNQDPIENFFGSLRSHGCRNINPTSEQFESAFSTLLVNSLSSVHAPGANCESDNCHVLNQIIITEGCKENVVCELSFIPQVSITPLEDKNDPRKIGGLQYVSGYFVKNAKKNVFKGCTKCNHDLINLNEMEYIKFREYTNKKWLCSPTKSLLVCISNLQDITYNILKTNLEIKNLKEFIKTIILIHIDFEFIKCEIHKEEIINYIIKISCRFFIHNYCKEINKILNNRRECDDNEDNFKIRAKKYALKCFKRKNK